MRILFVAPTSNLNSMSEISRVASGHHVDFCVDMVDRAKLELALAKSSYDVLHFMQHGKRGLLEFSDGALEASELVAMLRRTQTRLKFVVLNSCDSISTGVEIHNALLVPIVAHDASIEDAVAVRFAEALYRNMNSGMDLHTAFDAARVTLTRLYPQHGSTPQLINGSRATIDDLAVKFDECSHGMKADMANLRTDLTTAFEHFNQEIADLEEVIVTLNGQRHRHVETMAVVLLVALLIAQVLTPLMNAWLSH